jgi:hypothetical protein
MTDFEGQKDRPGAGSYSLEMHIEGFPLHCYLNYNAETKRVEVVRILPRGVPDQLAKDFSDDDSAWAWVRNEFRCGRLP